MFGRVRDVGVHVCLVAALAAASATAVGMVQSVNAVGAGTASSFVPIVPCRLADTRPGGQGTRSTPVGAAETVTFAVWGSNGSCTIPNTATGIASNVTAVAATAATFLTVFPADGERPTTSNLNPTPGQPPTPNQVTVGLSTTGAIKVFNNTGTLDLIIDIVGYYEPASAGPPGVTGAQGPTGSTGAAGAAAVDPARVVWVATSGTNTFPTVTAALASITDNSATNRYVIKIAPGTYLEPSGIDMKDFVDIEGSGQTATTITATSAATTNTTVRVEGNLHGEIRDLTINNSGGAGGTNVGLRFTSVTTTAPVGVYRVTDVTVTATGTGDNLGVYVVDSSPAFTNVTTTATGGTSTYPFLNDNSSPTMTGITATAKDATSNNFGIHNLDNSKPTITNTTATATATGAVAWGVYNDSSSPTMTNVTATATATGGNAFGVYNNLSSPTMTAITATAIGFSGNAFGVYNLTSSSPAMTGVNATATGGNAYGVTNVSSSPRMTGSTATATATTGEAYGVQNDSSSPTMTGITATATSGPVGAYGVSNVFSSSPTIRNSVISGATSIINQFGGTVTVSNSTLLGGAVGGIGFTCRFVINPTGIDTDCLG